MALSEGLNSIIGFIKRGFEGRDDDPFMDFEEEYTEEYAADGNAALDVMYSPKAESRWNKKEESNVVSHPNYRSGEVTIMEPRSFGEAVQIVKKLKDKNTVVLNLHLLDKEQSQRTIDFVCGAAHALNGTPQRLVIWYLYSHLQTLLYLLNQLWFKTNLVNHCGINHFNSNFGEERF